MGAAEGGFSGLEKEYLGNDYPKPVIGGGARSRVRYIPVLDGATSRRDRCRTGNESHPNAGLDKGRWRSGFTVYRTGSRSAMMTGEVSLGNMTRL